MKFLRRLGIVLRLLGASCFKIRSEVVRISEAKSHFASSDGVMKARLLVYRTLEYIA